MVRRCVLSRNLVNEEALAHWGLSRQFKKKNSLGVKQTADLHLVPTLRVSGAVPLFSQYLVLPLHILSFMSTWESGYRRKGSIEREPKGKGVHGFGWI